MCESTYTIDFRTGEKLECSGKHLRTWHGDKHTAEYVGVIWNWRTEEEDK